MALYYFTAYKDVTLIFNMPDKAAACDKPILLSTGYLMERRVMRYGRVLAVPQGDVEAMFVALDFLRLNLIEPSCFAAYRTAYSHEKLGMALDDFLKPCRLNASK